MTRNRSLLLCLGIVAMAVIVWPNWPSASSQTTPGQSPTNSNSSTPRRPQTQATPRRRTVRPATPGAEELLFWDSIKDSHDPADFNAYLTRYGERGKFSVLAHNRLNAIAAEQRANGGQTNSGPGRTNPPNRVNPNDMGISSVSNGTGTTGAARGIDAAYFVYIAPASFVMGSADDETGRDTDEGPQHQVTFARGFYVGKYEITQGQWRALMGTDPSKFGGCDECPVEQVSWDDAQQFISKLNGRNDGYRYSLPTEAQFEYLMRGGTTGMMAGDPDELGWYFKNSGQRTRPVGQKRPNAYGVYDLHGNVQEWVQDVYTQDYEGAPTDGSARSLGPDSTKRVIRGGSWYDQIGFFRSAYRVSRSSDDRNEYTGFRLVRMPVTSTATAMEMPKVLEFAYIAPASFMMGSPNGEAERDPDEGPQHRVTFRTGFYMGKYEITQSQWRAVMGTDPSTFANCDQCPVDGVSWNDAQAFIAKLNAQNDGYRYSLPTEAQFEYVMRGGKTDAYAGDPDSLGWYSQNSGGKTHPVGTKSPNAYGVYDMHGNVQEWIEDVYARDYDDAPSDGSAQMIGPEKDKHVLRGGSYIDLVKYFRSAFRITYAADEHHQYDGFRVVRVPVR